MGTIMGYDENGGNARICILFNVSFHLARNLRKRNDIAGFGAVSAAVDITALTRGSANTSQSIRTHARTLGRGRRIRRNSTPHAFGIIHQQASKERRRAREQSCGERHRLAVHRRRHHGRIHEVRCLSGGTWTSGGTGIG